MSSTNLDVTRFSPLSTEANTRPGTTPAVAVPADAVSGPSGDLKTTQSVTAANEASMDTLGNELEKLNAELHTFGIEFEISEEDQRLITRVVDRESGDLIRQIPSEEALRIARSLEKINGLLLKTSA